MAVAVREAVEADVPDLARIHVTGWQSAYRGIVPDPVLDAMAAAEHEDRWRRRLAERPPGVGYLVGELDGRVTSFVTFGRYRTQQDAEPGEDTFGWGEILALYTDPDRQGEGAGTAVHDAALAALTRHGFTQTALWVLRDNSRSRAWYSRKGWKTDGATSVWDSGYGGLPEVRMRHPLP